MSRDVVLCRIVFIKVRSMVYNPVCIFNFRQNSASLLTSLDRPYARHERLPEHCEMRISTVRVAAVIHARVLYRIVLIVRIATLDLVGAIQIGAHWHHCMFLTG